MDALHAAAGRGLGDAVKFLLANKADVNAKDREGLTPLYRAAAEGYIDVVQLLLENKADVNVTNVKGEHLCAILQIKSGQRSRFNGS